jgi:hypothetical protein
MAQSRFLDATINNATLHQYLKRKFPREDRISVIKPKLNTPCKGYFPASIICDTFDCDFADWKHHLAQGGRMAKIVASVRKQTGGCVCYVTRFL